VERNGKTLTEKDRQALLAVVPWLESDPQPELEWKTDQAFAYPEYDERVHQVASALGSEYWTDVQYMKVLRTVCPDTFSPGPELIEKMTLEQLCAAITAFQRGERFSNGHMGSQITSGAALALVKRALQVCDAILG